MAKLLAVDLDGTLFYPNQMTKCIPTKNIKFLRKWIDEGNKVVLVTSRSYDFTKKLQDEIQRPVDMICCTSSQIYVNNQMVRDVTMPRDTIRTILKDIKEQYQPICFMITTRNHPCIISDHGLAGKFLLFCYNTWRFFQFKRKEPFVISNEEFDKAMEEGDIYKAMIFFGLRKPFSKLTKELNKNFREKYSQLEFSWTAPINEITPLDCTKGSGVEYYARLMGFNSDDVYVVGDSGNDITMFQKFHEHSYCMKHAYTSVRKYAKHTISRVYKLDKLVLKGEKHESN